MPSLPPSILTSPNPPLKKRGSDTRGGAPRISSSVPPTPRTMQPQPRRPSSSVSRAGPRQPLAIDKARSLCQRPSRKLKIATGSSVSSSLKPGDIEMLAEIAFLPRVPKKIAARIPRSGRQSCPELAPKRVDPASQRHSPVQESSSFAVSCIVSGSKTALQPGGGAAVRTPKAREAGLGSRLRSKLVKPRILISRSGARHTGPKRDKTPTQEVNHGLDWQGNTPADGSAGARASSVEARANRAGLLFGPVALRRTAQEWTSSAMISQP